MTLPASGAIYLAQVNTELGRPATQWITMNDPDVRRLAGAPSGLIWMSQLHGKSNIVREPASGSFYEYGRTYFLNHVANWVEVMWNGTQVVPRSSPAATSYTVGTTTYYTTWSLKNIVGDYYWYDVYRTRLGP